MEHSALHAAQLLGVIMTVAGPFVVLVLLGRGGCRPQWEKTIARWTSIGALVAAFGTFADFFVQVAEIQIKTILGGVDLATVYRYVTTTLVGQLGLYRLGVLLLTALVVRFKFPGRWLLTGLLALGAMGLQSIVSHAGAQPTHRLPGISMQMVHLLAASAWIGVLLHLWLGRRQLTRDTPEDAATLCRLITRFSPVALTGATLLALSGVYTAVRYLVIPISVPTSAYGLTLCIKLVLILPVLYAGRRNWRESRPALMAAVEGGGTVARAEALAHFRKLLELEVTAGVLVVIVAGIVGSVSPPGADPNLRLTPAQYTALLHPDLPTTRIVDPATFYGALDRPVEDLRYAEFTHNWSGVMVTLLGLFWLVQSLNGRGTSVAAKTWPWLMVPFAIFVAVAADPEVWILHKVSVADAMADPQLLEHQLGAVMVLLLVWFGVRDLKNPPETRPLGYVLPVILIVGSLLLLGHAHSTLSETDELLNLINVQHAVFGGLGLFAGVVRWLQLRGLFADAPARWIWPSCVIAVGVFMAFFYREVV
jgi:putative copper resistance protein D